MKWTVHFHGHDLLESLGPTARKLLSNPRTEPHDVIADRDHRATGPARTGISPIEIERTDSREPAPPSAAGEHTGKVRHDPDHEDDAVGRLLE